MARRIASRIKAGAAAALLALLALAAAPAPAAADPARIERVISGQIEAFLADDFDAAFDYASPDIRRLFATPENFGRMVRRGYPMVWRPESFRFEALEEIDGRLRQSVLIRDGEGRVWRANYWMIRVEEAWRIDGVTLEEAGLAS